MINLITGIIGFIMVTIFLGYYFVTLSFIPLWFIIIIVLGLVVGDLVLSTKSNGNQTDV